MQMVQDNAGAQATGPAGPSRQALVLTALCVLAVHAWVLVRLPLASPLPPPPATPAVMLARTVAPSPKAPAVPAVPAAMATPAAAPSKPTAPRRAVPSSPKAAPTPPTSPSPVTEAPALAEAAPTAPALLQAPPPEAPPAPSSEPAPAAPALAESATTEPPRPAPGASDPPLAPVPEDPALALLAGPQFQSPGDPAPTAGSLTGVLVPAPVRLAFDVSGQAKRFQYTAQAELLWQHDGQRYEARQEIRAFLVGSRVQRSTGQITPAGLSPERFSDRSRSERAAHRDTASGKVTFSANTPEATVGPGAQDRLSVFIQLGAMMAAQPARFVPGARITLTTLSATSADRWTFTVQDTETLELPAGPTPAIKLLRLPRRDYDQQAELWVAPALGYLPVRIRLTQANGDFADLQLRSASAP